ncbi:MAG: DUF711 family protein, partial [Lentisphaerae bacterium]|nr:DUF711 family protein [Lentisphaerota bacterium]
MLRTGEILSTVRMLQEENLDVRTVTMGISLRDCARDTPAGMADAVGGKIRRVAADLVGACDALSTRYGLPVVNKRLAVSPVSHLLEGRTAAAALKVAEAMDGAARDVGVDFIGGFTALVHKGVTP